MGYAAVGVDVYDGNIPD